MKEALIDINRLMEQNDIKVAKDIKKYKVLRKIVSNFDDIKNIKQSDIDKVKRKICTNADQVFEDEYYEQYMQDLTSENETKSLNKTKNTIRKEARFLASWSAFKNRLMLIKEVINSKDAAVKVRTFARSLSVKKSEQKGKVIKVTLTDKAGESANVNLEAVNEVLDALEKEEEKKGNKEEVKQQANEPKEDDKEDKFKEPKKVIVEEF